MSDRTAVRALRPSDASAARALVSACTDGTRHSARTHEVLDAALAGGDEEHIGLVLPVSADDEAEGECAAVAVIGAVAGASGAWRLHGLFAHSPGAATLLTIAAIDAARDRGARLVVCELPDDAPFALANDAMASAGLTIEGELRDFVGDGIALRLWVARL